MGPMEWIQAGILAGLLALAVYGRVRWRRRMNARLAEQRRAHAERLQRELREAIAEAAESDPTEGEHGRPFPQGHGFLHDPWHDFDYRVSQDMRHREELLGLHD